MNGTSCMGGWCAIRERCSHYRPGDWQSDPVERMCDPKATVDQFRPGKWHFIAIEPRIEEAKEAA